MNPLLHHQSTFYSRREVVSDFQRQTDPEAAPGPPVKGDAVSTLMDVSERFMLKGSVISRHRSVVEHSLLRFLALGIGMPKSVSLSCMKMRFDA